MTFHADGRAISPVVGSILVFGLIIAVIALIQVNAVPLEVQQSEFEHNQLAQEQLLALDEDIEDSAAAARINTETVVLGTRYSAGFPFLSPGPAAGELRTRTSTVTLDNIMAVDPETADFWDGSQRPFDTQRILYEPNYNQYQNAPVTVLGPEGTYNRFDRENAVVGLDGGIVNGDTITLVVVEGQLSGSRVGARTIQSFPVEGPMRTTTVVSGTGADRIQITIQTDTPQRVADLYADEPNVADVTVNAGTVVLTLAPGTYDLRLGKVSLDSPAPADPAAYITNASDVRGSLRAGESQTLVFRVWTQYNTPVTGESVTLTITQGTSRAQFSNGMDEITLTTDDQGRVDPVLQTTDPGQVTVEASIGGGASAAETATESLVVLDPLGSGSDSGAEDAVSDINPGPGGESVYLEVVDRVSNDELDLTFNNEAAREYTLEQARVSFYFDSSSGTQIRETAQLSFGGQSTTINVADEFVDVSSLNFDLTADLTSAERDTIRIDFQDNFGQGDFFVLSTEWVDGAGDTIRVSYFIGVPRN